MKKVSALVLALGVFASGSIFAAEAWDLDKQKAVLFDIAFPHFVTENGEEALKTVSGFGIDRSIQGTSGKVKITFKNKEGVKTTASYFCHVHEADEIDCH